MVILARLDELMKEKHISRRQLEKAAGLGVATITKWKTKNPTNQNLQKVADVLHVSVAYLTGESDYRTEQDAVIHKWNEQISAGMLDKVKKIEAGIRIPVFDTIPCDIPYENLGVIQTEGWEEISELMGRSGSYFGLKVKDNSMLPRILAGDVLIVKQQPYAESGDIVIARVDDEEACCVRYIQCIDGIILQSFNHTYVPVFINNNEIQKGRVQIIGVVMENRQKLHRQNL